MSYSLPRARFPAETPGARLVGIPAALQRCGSRRAGALQLMLAPPLQPLSHLIGIKAERIADKLEGEVWVCVFVRNSSFRLHDPLLSFAKESSVARTGSKEKFLKAVDGIFEDSNH